MTDQDKIEVQKMIDDEIAKFKKYDRFIFDKRIQILDNRHIQVGRTGGTMIGTEGGATGQKLGFFGTTPIAQPAAISDPAGGGTAGVDSPARSAINSIIDLLQSLGLMQ